MRLYSHVIKNDTGLAPNPFHGFCTSAVCTPSHMRAKAERDDWLIGNSPIADQNRLVYAMRISDVISMDSYFNDPRFQQKKPHPDGDASVQCGDNLYYTENDGNWRRLPSRFHNDCGSFIKDVGKNFRGRPVFVSQHFYYFGDCRVCIPHELAGVIKDRQGIKRTTDRLAYDFVKWLEANHKPGVTGRPTNMSDNRSESGPMLTSWSADCEDVLSLTQTARSPNEPRSKRGC
jgi:hypothetical protein